ncbi:hypothetical protein ACFU8X_05210 [Brevibacillus porteri]|uniref:hypothetical protein n=1 Tax=Brevibacillus TaxID=55080 RepID=UPI0016439B10|nr:hypothetical protein [Brevibacillus brevis]
MSCGCRRSRRRCFKCCEKKVYRKHCFYKPHYKTHCKPYGRSGGHGHCGGYGHLGGGFDHFGGGYGGGFDGYGSSHGGGYGGMYGGMYGGSHESKY